VKPLYDPRDIKPDSKFKAKLLPDRTGIELIKPSIPFYLLNSVKAVNEAEKAHATVEKAVCAATSLDYCTQATAIAMDPERQIKRMVMTFPSNLKGSNPFMNDGLKTNASAGKHDLFTNARFITQTIEAGKDRFGKPQEMKEAGKDRFGKPQEMKWTASYVYGKIVVDGTIRNTEVVVEKDNDDILMSAMKSMSLNP
jgi:hypothetical protein